MIGWLQLTNRRKEYSQIVFLYSLLKFECSAIKQYVFLRIPSLSFCMSRHKHTSVRLFILLTFAFYIITATF